MTDSEVSSSSECFSQTHASSCGAILDNELCQQLAQLRADIVGLMSAHETELTQFMQKCQKALVENHKIWLLRFDNQLEKRLSLFTQKALFPEKRSAPTPPQEVTALDDEVHVARGEKRFEKAAAEGGAHQTSNVIVEPLVLPHMLPSSPRDSTKSAWEQVPLPGTTLPRAPRTAGLSMKNAYTVEFPQSIQGNSVMRRGKSTPCNVEAVQSRRKVKKKAQHFIIAQAKQSAQDEERLLHRITHHKAYESASMLLIVFNALVIGWQVQEFATQIEEKLAQQMPANDHQPLIYFVLQVVFCICFTCELSLRWAADGLIDFFRTPEWTWNVFDVVVVAFGVVEIFVGFAGGRAGFLSVLRILRILRIIRVVSVLRVLRFFSELRMMLNSILGSVKPLCWAMIILGLMFYVIGIGLTSGTCDFLVEKSQKSTNLNSDQMIVDLRKSYGFLGRSILTLFMSMSGGIDWSDAYRLLEELNPVCQVLFLAFIIFAIFAVVNVVTGVFVENARQHAGKDRDTLISSEMRLKEQYLANMQEVFEEMDADGTGTISRDEFHEHLNNAQVVAYFNALKLDVSDLETLFTLLDHDHSGTIELNEFVTGCQRLKGESRSLDIALLRFQMDWMVEKLSKLPENPNSQLLLQSLSRTRSTIDGES